MFIVQRWARHDVEVHVRHDLGGAGTCLHAVVPERGTGMLESESREDGQQTCICARMGRRKRSCVLENPDRDCSRKGVRKGKGGGGDLPLF